MEERICMPSVTYPARPPHYHGFCWGCCHPVSQCCCCAPQCRKEAKELVVSAESEKRTNTGEGLSLLTDSAPTLAAEPTASGTANALLREESNKIVMNPIGTGSRGLPTYTAAGSDKATAFIGGGCCVHLSVEYMPLTPGINSDATVVVGVKDSEGTTMRWSQTTGPGSVYQVRENIITTKPGALLTVTVENMIARVRWCEIFSC